MLLTQQCWVSLSAPDSDYSGDPNRPISIDPLLGHIFFLSSIFFASGITFQPVEMPTTNPALAPVDPDDIPKTLSPAALEDDTPPPAIMPTPSPLAPGSTRAPVPTPVPVATPAPSSAAPSVSGVMTMSTRALAACEDGCESGLAIAFDLQPYLVRIIF